MSAAMMAVKETILKGIVERGEKRGSEGGGDSRVKVEKDGASGVSKV